MRDVDHILVRDSILMRFVFTSEVSWKSIKAYLEEKFALEISVPSDVYRAALKVGMLTAEDTQRCLEMIRDRNRLAHDYSEKFAEGLYARIKNGYAPLLRSIINHVPEMPV